MEAIILAAGYSSRANSFKMTQPIEHKTVLEHTLSKFDGICTRVIVVAGFQADNIAKEIERMNWKDKYSFQIDVVMNADFSQGMFSSIQTGCKEVMAPYFFITPGDCPLVKKETVHLLSEKPGHVVIPSFNYKGGHPILLSGEVKQRILDTNPESNLRQVLSYYEKNYINVDDLGVIMDIDTPLDFQYAKKYYQQHFLNTY
ncbi:nucleotidyltransferase family protein [Bacillus marasmi]|uniref:nucleotidyltransferase family protein n=1 Tax=Bacillus marasmi TaxID=1926279 RepID=UPI0011C926A3|nr:nucleotidyltransferase family protein [Bacillus marasmi]